jgi:hypothetical protein
MTAKRPSDIRRAAFEVEQSLQVRPESKGKPFGLGHLSPAVVDLLARSVVPLPETLRRVRCGPIDVYFDASEADRMVKIYIIRLRGQS